MPTQKDLKRIVRARMEKTGESYTTARLHVVRKAETPLDYSLAGMSDDSVKKATGRDWPAWVKLLDAAGSAEKAHRDIAKYVSSLGTPDWWSQMVTVGYERIRGLRARNQQRDGAYEAHKSKTFAVPVARLYKAFADTKQRAKWLDAKVVVKASSANKTMRISMEDNTSVQIGFTSKSAGKSAVAIQHSKLPDKAAADRIKAWWGEQLGALANYLR